jgi:hypothetical protein
LADPLARARTGDADPAPGTSALHLPVLHRPADAPAPRPLPEPPPRQAKAPVTRCAKGRWSAPSTPISGDGETLHRFFLDGGVFGPVGDMRLDEIGTVLSDISDRRYTIHADDPLSARATMEQTASFTRDDWR